MSGKLNIISSPAAFRSVLEIDTDAGPRKLAKAADPWQLKDFAALDAAWLRVARRGDGQPTVGRAYLERPRGHSKTGDLAIMVAWALLASSRKLSGVAAAADKDQAKLLRDAIEKLLRLNPWLAELLEVQAYRVLNKHTGSTLEIMAADVPGSWGITPDFIVVDELTHWTDAGENFWLSLFSSAAKRESCLLIVISNAGVGKGTSWQWRVREAARESEDFYFSRIEGVQASWISQRHLAQQRGFLPPMVFDRLWLNHWVSSSGDAISEAEIAAAVRLDGPPEDTCNYLHVAGLDLGLKKDASALVVIGKEIDGERVKLMHVETWKADPGEKVSINEIEHAIAKVNKRFELQTIAVDPWQAAYLMERLDQQGIPTREVPFSAKNTQAMASAMLEVFGERRIELWDHETLLSDLRSLRIELKGNGYKLTANRNADGHADRAFALALALLAAADVSGGRSNIRSLDWNEVKDLPTLDELMAGSDVKWETAERGWQSETFEGGDAWR